MKCQKLSSCFTDRRPFDLYHYHYQVKAAKSTSKEEAAEQLYNMINNQKLKKNRFNSVHLAVKQNDLEMLKILLRNGGNLNEKTVSGYTPFILACHYGHVEIIQYLLHLYDQFEANKSQLLAPAGDGAITSSLDDESMQFFASTDPHMLLRCLYTVDGETGAVVEHHQNGNALNGGAEDDDDVVIVNRYLFNVNQKTDHGNTGLHQAVQQQHRMVIRLLLSNKTVHVDEANDQNKTPLDLAQQFNLIEIIKEFQFVHEERIVDNITKRMAADGIEGAADMDDVALLKQMPEDADWDDDIENEEVVREFVKVKSYDLGDGLTDGGGREESKDDALLESRMEENPASNVTKNYSIMEHLGVGNTTTSTDYNEENGDNDNEVVLKEDDDDFEELRNRQTLPPVQAG